MMVTEPGSEFFGSCYVKITDDRAVLFQNEPHRCRTRDRRRHCRLKHVQCVYSIRLIHHRNSSHWRHQSAVRHAFPLPSSSLFHAYSPSPHEFLSMNERINGKLPFPKSQNPIEIRGRTTLGGDFIAPLAAPQGSFDLTATNDGPNIRPRVIVRIIPTPFV
ncbi:unnamed protein product [Rodentolepis nana]|uniref:MSP domain-containing protein n=1 Tax=Rodentolepis nana TaxID=102285 RepID=A0A0R3TDJ4_RODNA|nr:unnamed protein product [Rodentolepis nana]